VRTKSDRVAAMGKAPLFAELGKKDLALILDQMREERYRAGEVIVNQGDPGGRLFLVVDGYLRPEVSGTERGQIGPGALIGEISAIDRLPRTATIKAASEVTLLSMTSHNFMAILDSYPTIARHVMIGLCKLVRSEEKRHESTW